MNDLIRHLPFIGYQTAKETYLLRAFAYEMLADDRVVERKPVEGFILKKVTVGLFRKTFIPA